MRRATIVVVKNDDPYIYEPQHRPKLSRNRDEHHRHTRSVDIDEGRGYEQDRLHAYRHVDDENGYNSQDYRHDTPRRRNRQYEDPRQHGDGLIVMKLNIIISIITVAMILHVVTTDNMRILGNLVTGVIGMRFVIMIGIITMAVIMATSMHTTRGILLSQHLQVLNMGRNNTTRREIVFDAANKFETRQITTN